jgi:hypothetical protein
MENRSKKGNLIMNNSQFLSRTRIDTLFGHDLEFDYINLRIKMQWAVTITTDYDDRFLHEKAVSHTAPCELTVYMSSVWCSFKGFVRFLEAIARQDQECSFGWDAEGPDGEMRWNRINNDTGLLTVFWNGRLKQDEKRNISYRMLLNTRQLVQILYTSFRRFIDSPEYDPIRYEKLNGGEAFSFVLTDAEPLKVLAHKLVDMDRIAAERLIYSLCDCIAERSVGGPRLQHPLDHFVMVSKEIEVGDHDIESHGWIPKSWDSMDKAQRMNEIISEKGIFTGGPPNWYGTNLRTLKSSAIEKYLA